MFAEAKFKVTGWDEEPYDEPEDGPKLTRVHVTRSFTGDLTGTGNLTLVMTYLDSEIVSFIGFERVVGSLGGRAGSFVLRHAGIHDGQGASADLDVVSGSGTGELARLEGTGEFSAGDEEFSDMTLDYEL
jgi:hypothetical protein